MIFKARSSKAGTLFTRGGASSVTVQTWIEEYIKEQVYGVKKEFSNKYTTKGIAMEDAAIDTAIEYLKLPFVMKNEEYFEDEYFTGTPDIVLPDEIIDIKCSFDCFTFPLFVDAITKKDGSPLTKYRLYFTQLQVYMHLTGKKKARLCYVLMNTPDNIEPWKEKHDYSHIDMKYRVKTFSIDYDPACIMELKELVRDARLHVSKLQSMIK